ncbi:DoxX family protein [Solihabitans fulvus]|uniref:DoxX family protein n=1 Tax=Solihabitans fulvus TaxID=1892852 RepID=UPI0016621203|nr:DoxX family protein [Solihabitans fulvus]
MRLSLGIVFVWFGLLKFFEGMSPAAELATRTMSIITFDLVPPAVSRPLLALMETLIGVGFLTGRWPRTTLAVFFVQMAGAMSPLVLLPGVIWAHPMGPTLTGQYVIKDVVLVVAGLVVASALRAAPAQRAQPRLRQVLPLRKAAPADQPKAVSEVG